MALAVRLESLNPYYPDLDMVALEQNSMDMQWHQTIGTRSHRSHVFSLVWVPGATGRGRPTDVL